LKELKKESPRSYFSKKKRRREGIRSHRASFEFTIRVGRGRGSGESKGGNSLNIVKGEKRHRRKHVFLYFSVRKSEKREEGGGGGSCQLSS